MDDLWEALFQETSISSCIITNLYLLHIHHLVECSEFKSYHHDIKKNHHIHTHYIGQCSKLKYLNRITAAAISTTTIITIIMIMIMFTITIDPTIMFIIILHDA